MAAVTRLGLYGGSRSPYGSFAGKSANVTVPDVTGLSQEDAETALTDEGLVLGDVTEANSNVVASGLVISQDPAADEVVSPGSAVAIVVSLGAEAVSGGWIPKKRKPQKPDWQKRDEERAKFEAVLRNAYAEITGEAPATPVEREITREAIALVAPFVEGGKKRKRPPPAARVDFERLARNAERAAELIELLDRKRDEEEAVTLLLM